MATTKVFNMAGGKHSAEAYSSFEGLLYGSCVASGLTITKSSSNMNCSIAAGAGLIKVGSTYARRFAIEGGSLTVAVSAASTTLARRDTIVLYVDNSVTPTTSVEDNTNNILKGMVVAGTPAQNPTAPNATTIQSAVGAGNPYIILYDILVPANATNLSTATLYDRRVMASDALIEKLSDGSVTKAKLASAAVDNSKLDYSALYISATPLAGNKSTNANTKTEIQSLTLPAGKWRVTYLIRGFYTGSNPLVDSFLNDGSSDLIELAINAGFSGSDARFEVFATKEITLSGTKTLKSMITTPSAATVSPTSDLFAFRVA